jgi:integrase
MKMALPRGMYPHPKTGVYWVRKDVPKPLQSQIGKTSLKQTLGTKDPDAARSKFHEIMQQFEDQIAAAKKALAEGRQMPFLPVMITADWLTSEQAEAYARFEAMKPENQMRATAERIEKQLHQAGLAHPVVDTLSLDQLFEKWKAENKPSPNSEEEYGRIKRWFKELCRDLPITEYTVVHARQWKEHVLQMRGHNGKPLAHATMVKNFSMIRTLFRYADNNEYLTANPFSKITIEKNRGKAKKRQEWDIDELQKLFDSPIYTEGERPGGGSGEAAFWLPVLALYHGSRLGELCQLDKADVVKRNGVLCLRMVGSDEDVENGKSLKTESSERYVPLHKRVLELGFMDYVQSVGSKKLWPKLQPDFRSRWSGKWTKWFGRHRANLGLGGRFRDFHSFRDGWKTAARGVGIPEEHHDEITGHESGSVGRKYGSVPIPKLKREIDKIRFKVKIPKWNLAD